MVTIEEYSEAQRVISEYENQHNLITWICTKTLYMKDDQKAFTKGKEYYQIEDNELSVINDFGSAHHFGTWEIHFEIV